MQFFKWYFKENLYKQDFHLKIETIKWDLNYVKMECNIIKGRKRHLLKKLIKHYLQKGMPMSNWKKILKYTASRS